jgi:hypothetical protein
MDNLYLYGLYLLTPLAIITLYLMGFLVYYNLSTTCRKFEQQLRYATNEVQELLNEQYQPKEKDSE